MNKGKEVRADFVKVNLRIYTQKVIASLFSSLSS
jgi:hypothetical protein